jgi:hypothetical protein
LFNGSICAADKLVISINSSRNNSIFCEGKILFVLLKLLGKVISISSNGHSSTRWKNSSSFLAKNKVILLIPINPEGRFESGLILVSGEAIQYLILLVEICILSSLKYVFFSSDIIRVGPKTAKEKYQGH